MPVHQPWSLDVDTIVGVAITQLVVLAVQVATWRRERRQNSAALSIWNRAPDPFRLNAGAVAGTVLTIEVSYSGGSRTRPSNCALSLHPAPGPD